CFCSPSPVVLPEAEVEEDSGAARDREQCEHEADEGRVDTERRRDPSTDARDYTVVPAAFERQHRDLIHPACTTSIRPAPTFASITSGPWPTWTTAFLPSSWP